MFGLLNYVSEEVGIEIKVFDQLMDSQEEEKLGDNTRGTDFDNSN